MTKEESVLLQLIKQAQFTSSEDFDWDSIDFDALYKEASAQSLLGLVSSVIPDEYLNDDWNKIKHTHIQSYVRYMFHQDNLRKLLDNAGIPFVILKGNAAAVNYKNPYYRSMGDIDFLVPQDLYNKTKEILSSSGYIAKSFNGRHQAYSYNGLCFELHHHFSNDVDIEDYIIEGLKSPVIVSVDSHEFPILPRLSNGLVFLDHMRFHLKASIGLRQAIDWMMYVNNYLDDDFWKNEFQKVVEEKGMEILAITATRMCQIYLGLPETITWCKDADENDCRMLMDCILSSGNFGRKNGKGKNVELISTNIKRYGLFKWLQIAGEHNWNAYHNHHWLKPFCWLYQIFRYTKQRIQSGRNSSQLKSDFERSNNRYELLKRLGIE